MTQVRIEVNVNSSVASTSLLNQAFVEFAGRMLIQRTTLQRRKSPYWRIPDWAAIFDWKRRTLPILWNREVY